MTPLRPNWQRGKADKRWSGSSRTDIDHISFAWFIQAYLSWKYSSGKEEEEDDEYDEFEHFFEQYIKTEAEQHIRGYIGQMSTSIGANARTMKLMARTIYQKVILRESEARNVPEKHVVELADVEMLKWFGKKGRMGF